MPPDVPRLLTSGKLARRLRVSVGRVLYLLRRADIPPAALAGRVRLYTPRTVARLRYLSNVIDAKRCARQEVALAGD